MQIISLQLKNVKSHRDAVLVFAPGINVLSGPNGAGKSTIFEAIGYALFGVDARDFVTNAERFLSIGARKGEVAVTFRTDGGETWRVTRTVGTPAKWLLAKEQGGAFEVEEHAKSEETAARLAELLGLDNGRPLAEQFKLVIGPFQNDFLGPFVIRQPTKRQEAFDEILGIDAWRKTFKGTSALLAAVQERLKVLAAELAAKEEQVAELPAREEALAGAIAARAARQEELLARETALRQATERLGEEERRKELLEAAEGAARQTATQLEAGREYVASQQRLVEQAEAAAAAVAANRPGREAFQWAEQLLTGLRERERQRRAIEREIGELDRLAVRLAEAYELEVRELATAEAQLAAEGERLTAARRELAADGELAATAARLPALRDELERRKGERARLTGRRAGLEEGAAKLGAGVCPFLGEPCRNLAAGAPGDLFDDRFATLDRELARLDAAIADGAAGLAAAEGAERELAARRVRGQELEKQLAALVERQRQLAERRAGLAERAARRDEAAALVAGRRQELAPFAELDDEIVRAEEERSRHQPARDACQANEQAAGELASRQQTLVRYQGRLAELQAQLAAQQAEAERLRAAYQPARHEELRQQKETLVAGVATLRQQLDDLERERQRLAGELGRLREIVAEIGRKREEQAACTARETLVKFLRNQVFKNVSGQLSERFREEIGQRADRIYRTIAETDEELVWGEGYQIVLRDLQEGGVRERSDDQLSGGQTMSAVVALRLALLQTVGARIAFFDEPTSNLDAARRENLAHAFRAIDVGREELTEHWYDQLFLISHDVAFTEITDQTIQLAGAGGTDS